jgi:hypothetical protein
MINKLVYQHVDWRAVCPSIMINAFPKAGTHMAEQMIRELASPASHPLAPQPWAGNIGGHGFWNVPNPQVGEHEAYERLRLCMPGQYYKAHAMWQRVYANFLDMSGYGMVFMYRDLRDVAVSWAHHVTVRNKPTLHPAKQFFQLIEAEGDFEDVLLSVIEGIPPLPGVVEHWEDFAPWLDEDWILPVKYEDMLHNPEEVAERVFFYLVERSCEVRQKEYRVSERVEGLYKAMADATRRREESLTFRRGVAGGWKDEFTLRVAEAFVAHGGHEWLVKLGYEES